MAYHIDWYQDKRIVLCSAEGTITDADLWEMGQTLTTFLDQGQSSVDVILNLEAMERFPKQLPKMRRVLRDFFEHPRLRSITLVGRVNPLARCIFETLTKTFRVPYRNVAPDMQAAVRAIQTTAY